MPQEPRILSTEELAAADAKWVTLQKIKWQDPTGKERIWEAAARKTRGSTGVDAVAILAIIRSESNAFPPSTVIIEQFRPPVGKFVIELPAGLIDPKESPEEAAVRELEEETGYKTTLKDILESAPVTVSDPGMTNANMKLVIINVNVPASETKVPEPDQKLDQGEFIVKRVVALKELSNVLEEYDSQGYTVDAKLSHFALGYRMAGTVESS
ncbi:hypothetical protein SISNIDRAFT_408508 [Sistotremastrum niveocremeum HHB9708]|uniref:Nudix hydrolase domain-containing protein n=1 Tax=Sistotremastrum niveocremeum HHB9708 TaxID=1314777 RepID=A0A164X621_9AGAM|nr:hypothetical protein SISNIDRAFT_408508 [Sistotremastrum niveocremeum HHB9708]